LKEIHLNGPYPQKCASLARALFCQFFDFYVYLLYSLFAGCRWAAALSRHLGAAARAGDRGLIPLGANLPRKCASPCAGASLSVLASAFPV